MGPEPRSRPTDACLAFCGECRHLALSISGPHGCAKGHDLADSQDYLRCADRSPWPKAEGGASGADLSE